MNQTGTRHSLQHGVNLQTRRLQRWLIGLLIISNTSPFVISRSAIYADPLFEV